LVPRQSPRLPAGFVDDGTPHASLKLTQAGADLFV
jgi:hypothetical protein